jgi:lysozyme
MKTSQQGIDLITRFEGFSAVTYICPAGYPTIGYGHRVREPESFTRLTKKQAALLLVDDVKPIEKFINGRGWNLQQNEFDALVSFIYNVGVGAFKNSSVMKYINQGNKRLAATWILAYNKSRGTTLPGLVKRREVEYYLFISKEGNRDE